jgi:hypothetical protein
MPALHYKKSPGAAGTLTGGADASQTDPLKKINGLLAS